MAKCDAVGSVSSLLTSLRNCSFETTSLAAFYQASRKILEQERFWICLTQKPLRASHRRPQEKPLAGPDWLWPRILSHVRRWDDSQKSLARFTPRCPSATKKGIAAAMGRRRRGCRSVLSLSPCQRSEPKVETETPQAWRFVSKLQPPTPVLAMRRDASDQWSRWEAFSRQERLCGRGPIA